MAEAAQQVQEKTAQVAHDAGEKLKGLSPASTTSTISTAASSTADAFHKAEQKVEEIPQGAQRSCGDTFRNHYSGRIDLLAWHKDEMTLAKEAGVSLVQSGVDSLSTAGTTASDNVAPWFQSGQKAFKGGDKDCVHNTRHCECSLGDAFGRIFHKTESVAGQAGQSVKGAAQQAGQAVKGAADQAGQAATGAGQAAKGAVQQAGQAAKGAADQAGQAVKGAVQ